MKHLPESFCQLSDVTASFSKRVLRDFLAHLPIVLAHRTKEIPPLFWFSQFGCFKERSDAFLAVTVQLF